jgi:hypothetical protein
MEMDYNLQNLEYEDLWRLFINGTLSLDDAVFAHEENPPQEVNFRGDTVDVTYGDGVISVRFLRLIDVGDDDEISELLNPNFYSVIEDIVAWINDSMVSNQSHQQNLLLGTIPPTGGQQM